MKTKLLLIADDGLARDAYGAVLEELDVEVVCIQSPDEIAGALEEDLYNGLLIDVPTMIQCESSHKNRITEIMERFPALRLMYNAAYGTIRGLAKGGTIRDNHSLEDFVLHECVPFPARSIRFADRSDVVFNVMLLKDYEMAHGERTVTTNLSEYGCFVHTVTDWQEGGSAFLIFNELDDKTPVEIKVCWARPWGRAMAVPGFGASFESMTAHQFVQLHSYL